VNLEEIKDYALQLIDEYSSNGEIISELDNADELNKMTNLANDALTQLARYDRIPAVYRISNNPPDNLLGKYDSFDMVQYDGTDLTYSATGAKSYYFQVDMPCTVYVEEETSADNWAILKTIIVPDGTATYTEYRGNITPSDSSNSVRLRFTGEYPFTTRFRALYKYSYPTDDDVPSYEPYIYRDLPSDFWKLNKIIYQSDTRTHDIFMDYYIQNKQIALNRFYDGSFEIYYWKIPDKLSDNADVPEIQEINHYGIAEYIAGKVLISRGEVGKGTLLINMFEARKQEIQGVEDGEYTTIANMLGW